MSRTKVIDINFENSYNTYVIIYKDHKKEYRVPLYVYFRSYNDILELDEHLPDQILIRDEYTMKSIKVILRRLYTVIFKKLNYTLNLHESLIPIIVDYLDEIVVDEKIYLSDSRFYRLILSDMDYRIALNVLRIAEGSSILRYSN